MFHSLLVTLLFCCYLCGNVISYRVLRQSGGNSCTTPDNQQGTCIPLENCSYLHVIVKTLRAQEPKITAFLKKSQCDIQIGKPPKVCCAIDLKPPPEISPDTRITNDSISETNPSAKNYSICGDSDFLKISGGQNASLGDFPWIVAIGYRRPDNPNITWDCGGTLISNRWVVTAAHCTRNIGSLILTSVRMGELNLNEGVVDGASPVDIEVESIIPHPRYDDRQIVNDIALLRLKKPVTYTAHIRPLCIPDENDEYKSDGFYVNKSPFIAGWGHTQFRGVRSEMLLYAQVDVIDAQICERNYQGSRVSIDPRVLCAMRTGVDSCQGDSGGPLMMPLKRPGRLALFGIVSFGVGCANQNYPGVYTRVPYFSNWIKSTTGLA